MEEFSNWYPRRRGVAAVLRNEGDAYQTIYTVLTIRTRVMAPALPFLTEEIYQNLVCSVDSSAPESVHLTRYPQVDASLIDEELSGASIQLSESRTWALSLRTQSKTKDPHAAGYVVRSAQRRS